MKRKKYGGLVVRKKATQAGRSPAWRLEGSIDGNRIRETHPTKEQADEARRLHILESASQDSTDRAAVTWLTENQLRDAEAVYRQLPEDMTLSELYHYWKERFNPAAANATLSDAAKEFFKSLRTKEGNPRHWNNVKATLNALQERFPEATLADTSPDRLEAFLRQKGGTPKTYNNRRSDLSAFFSWAVQKELLSENPIKRVFRYDSKKLRKGVPEILSVQTCKELMEYADTYRGGLWAPFFAMLLFAGIRPSIRDGEVRHMHEMGWHRFVEIENGLIRLPPSVTKTKGSRVTLISPNLRKWLLKYPPETVQLIPGGPDAYSRIKTKFGIGHDYLRHTFISMLWARDKSFGDAAAQSGNSETIIRRHYFQRVTDAEAEAFWAIEPQIAADNVIQLKKAN